MDEEMMDDEPQRTAPLRRASTAGGGQRARGNSFQGFQSVVPVSDFSLSGSVLLSHAAAAAASEDDGKGRGSELDAVPTPLEAASVDLINRSTRQGGRRAAPSRPKTQDVFEITLLSEAERAGSGHDGARVRMEMKAFSRLNLLKYIDNAASEEDFEASAAPAAAAPAVDPASVPDAAALLRLPTGVAAMLRRKAAAAQATTAAIKAARAAAQAAARAALPALTTADLRLVDPQQDSYRKPVLAQRRGCLVLSLPPIRALIFTRRVLLFLEAGADGDIEPIVSRMRSWSQGRADDGVAADDPFVHAAFAAMLGGTVVVLEGRVNSLAALVKQSTAAGNRRRSAEVQFEYLQHGETVCHEVTNALEGVAHCVDAAAEAAGEAAEAEEKKVAAAVAAAAADSAAGGAAGGGGVSPRSSLALLARTRTVFEVAADEPLTNSLLGLMDASEDHLDQFAAEVGDLLMEARSLQQKLDMERKRITVSLAKQRNNILRIGIMIQLFTAVLGGCSVVSGYFGMNLDNGGCGPDGCHDMLAADHGYQRFTYVTSTSAMASLLCGIVAYLVIRRHI